MTKNNNESAEDTYCAAYTSEPVHFAMASYWATVLIVILCCYAECAVSQIIQGEVSITGHETPLIIGLQRDLVCTWSGEENAARMEWFLFLAGLDTGPLKSETNTSSSVLSPDPTSSGLDGAMFTCRVTTTNGEVFEETITVEIRELENIVSVIASTTTPTAGQPFSLICNITSSLLPLVTWLDPTGEAVNGSGVTLSPQVTNGLLTTTEITVSSLHTSHSGIYTCISNINDPPSRKNATYLIRVQIPPPIVLITREPLYPVQLFHTNRLVLTCTVLLIPEVDTPVTITSQWTGNPSLSDNHRRVIVSELEGLHPIYQSSVTFSTLKSSDTGSYTCSANVSPVDLRNVTEEEDSGNFKVTEQEFEVTASQWTSSTLSIIVTLDVTIEVTYNPPSDFTLSSPPYYRPATSVTLTCHAHGATGNVTYQWSSTCSSCFASRNTSQSVSDDTLMSSDAGIHKCTATDSEGNTGANSTEMKIVGAGIYIVNSRYYQNTAVPNNALIVQQSSCSSSCRKVEFYCYSNSSLTDVGYIYFPNDNRVYSSSRYYDMAISRVSPSGIHVRNSYNDVPDYWGIYTCQIPDSQSRTLETNIGLYSSMPSAPSVYSAIYNDLSKDQHSSALATITCQSRYSPPTNVTWQRDGVTIEIDGNKYEMTQTVTDRSNSYYDTILYIRDALGLAGSHTYTCSISNYAGSTSKDIPATLDVLPAVSTMSIEEPTAKEPCTLTCRASFDNGIISSLIPYLVLEWSGPDGVVLREENGVTIEDQETVDNEVTKSLTFLSLNITHGGTYKCIVKLLLPNSSDIFNSTTSYNLIVKDRTIIQLKFGPVLHCSEWYQQYNFNLYEFDPHNFYSYEFNPYDTNRYEYMDLGNHLDGTVRQFISGIVNKNCSCGFSSSSISQGEFSCQTSKSDVIYRIHITTNAATLPNPELLAPIQEWLNNDGTFLFTEYGRIRLRADPHCPLEIRSFTDPECGGNQDMKRSAPSTSAAHKALDEL